jgi:hypothetical protein
MEVILRTEKPGEGARYVNLSLIRKILYNLGLLVIYHRILKDSKNQPQHPPPLAM